MYLNISCYPKKPSLQNMARTVSPPRTSTRSPPTQRHSSSSTTPPPTTTTCPTTGTNTTTTSNRSLILQRAAERPNIPIAPASSHTSSPIYSTTSSPPISPGISHYSNSSIGTMAPSRSDSRSVALTMDLPTMSTPTGRISKAKKGKRVHACEFPGCGKIFTRAEHKRRHELNHNPDASYRCSQQGCGKSFHRVDLLQRHQERHELEASTQPSSPSGRRYPTHSTVPEPSAALPSASMASPTMAPVPPRTSAGGLPITSLVNHHPHGSYHPDAVAAFGLYDIPFFASTAESWNPLYVTGNIPSSHMRAYHSQSDSAASSVAAYDHTASPMVSHSWTQAPPTAMPVSMYEDSHMSPYAHTATVHPNNLPLSDLDGLEWSDIRRELQSVPGLLPNDTRPGVPALRWQCWSLYWQCFHPTYPIVHGPTNPPPLLACAMVAIGSYYDTASDGKQYSLALLEIATKILSQRKDFPSKNHKARNVDLQTVVLLEILSTFCARQTSVQTSTKFRQLFASPSNQPAIVAPLAIFRTLKANRTLAELHRAHDFWLENETRSRILHACSVLDAQRADLFGQRRTVAIYPAVKSGSAAIKQISLPCDDDLWDATPIERWAELAEKHEYSILINGKPKITPGGSANFSYFQQQVINANSVGHLRCTPTAQDVSISLDPVIAKADFDYHATWMCKHTPVQQLLAITGESWVLGRKMEQRRGYDTAKRELRKWLDCTPSAQKPYPDCMAAHWHALKLLRILHIGGKDSVKSDMIFGTTSMLHENWVIYLACLVCWAHGRRRPFGGVTSLGIQPVPDSDGRTRQSGGTLSSTGGVAGTATTLSTSCLKDPVRAAQEAETYLMFTNVSSPASLLDLDPAILSRTQGLLESVRTSKLIKHMMGGLMNDAEQVLLKLVESKSSINF